MCIFSQIRGGGVLYNHSREKREEKFEIQSMTDSMNHNTDQNMAKMMLVMT